MATSSLPDVLVVGAGIAGAAAGLELARRRVGFIGVDRAARFGGTARSGGIGSSIANSPAQRDLGIVDSWQQAVCDLAAEGNDPDPAWSRFYYRRSARDVYGWFAALGVTIDRVVLHEGDSVPRWHLPFGGGPKVMGAAWDQYGALGLQGAWRFGLTVEDLVEEGNRISGIVVRDTDGQLSRLAARTVLLATGGFGANLDMGLEVSPRFRAAKRVLAGGSLNAQGQLHAIVARHGGRLAKLEDVYAYASGTPDYRDPTGKRGVVVRSLKSGIWINRSAQRFHDEDIHFTGRSAVDHLLAQPDGTAWAIFDDAALSEIEVVDHYIEPNSETREQRLQKFIDNSRYFARADTLAALARQLGLPIDALERTVAGWNGLIASCAAVDPLTGRSLAALRPLGRGGWRAIQFFPLLRKTMGGVVTDRRCRVLDADGRPIPGLFAAGELAGMGGGGMAGWRPLEGTMAGGSLFSGQIAGRWIARSLQRCSAPAVA